jgi:hypothetical protein
MEEKHLPAKDTLLYWTFAGFGAALVFLSFYLRTFPQGATWADLSLNVGATLISTAGISFLYQHFGSENLIRQIAEMRRSLIIAQRGLELGIRNMWRERRGIESSYWNTFTAPAQSEVWLLGVAEKGFAEDHTFRVIVSNGTARGCRYRFLLLDPDSAAAAEIDNKEKGAGALQGRIRGALRQFQNIQKENVGKRGSVQVRVYAAVPQVSVVRSDNELLVTPYISPLPGNSCFTMRIQIVDGGIFGHYLEHFETLWEGARELPVAAD